MLNAEWRSRVRTIEPARKRSRNIDERSEFRLKKAVWSEPPIARRRRSKGGGKVRRNTSPEANQLSSSKNCPSDKDCRPTKRSPSRPNRCHRRAAPIFRSQRKPVPARPRQNARRHPRRESRPDEVLGSGTVLNFRFNSLFRRFLNLKQRSPGGSVVAKV